LIDLPRFLASEEAFRRDALLHDLVPSWQIDVPIRALEEQGWLQPGALRLFGNVAVIGRSKLQKSARFAAEENP